MLKIVRSVFCAMLLVFLASTLTFARVDIHEETLTGAKVITVGDKEYQWLDPGASNRDVTLGSGIAYAGKNYVIYNSGSSNNLVIKDASATTLVTLMPTEAALVISRNGTTWVAQQWTSPEYIDFPSEATETEMAAGSETDLRSMSPALVRNAVERIPRTKYCSTAAAVVAAVADSNYDVIAPTADFTLTAPLTIPSGKTYAPVIGAVVTTSAVNTLTFAAGSHLVDNGGQMFDASPGEVQFAPGSIFALRPQMWGSPGDGTVATAALQATINAAAGCGAKIEIVGHHKFTKLYLYYDATLNPTYPSGNHEKGMLTIEGTGAMNQWQQNDGTLTNYKSILESTDATGPAISIDLATGWTNEWIQIRDLSIVAENTTQVLYFHAWPAYSKLENVFIWQAGTGDGIYALEAWMSGMEFVNIIKDSVNAGTGYGVRIENTSGGIGGSIFPLTNVTSYDFATGFKLGGSNPATYGGIGKFILTGCQAKNCTIGFDIGGLQNPVRLISCHTEWSVGGNECATAIQVTGGEIHDLTIENCTLRAYDYGIKIGGAATDDIINVSIKRNRISLDDSVDSDGVLIGILLDKSVGDINNVDIDSNYFIAYDSTNDPTYTYAGSIGIKEDYATLATSIAGLRVGPQEYYYVETQFENYQLADELWYPNQGHGLKHFKLGGKKHSYGTAAPTSSAAIDRNYVGDVVWNTAMSAGGPEGWVCTAEGAPGTWRAMGRHGGNTASRPTLSATDHGFLYYDTDLAKAFIWSGSVWKNADGIISGEYDFAVSGGATGDYTVGALPDNATITKAWYEVLTPPTSGGLATIALGVATNDATGILGATAYDNAAFTAGYHDTACDGAAANFTTKTTAARNVVLTVAGAALTAGNIYVYFEYTVSE